MISGDEQRELDLAVWEYLLQRGFGESAATLQEEARLSPPAPTEGLLQRKWTTVLHLQARVEELEEEGRQEKEKASLHTLQMLSSQTGDLQQPRLRLIKTYTGHKDAINAVALHPREPIFASGGPDATIRLFDFELQDQMGLLRGHTFAVNCLGWGSHSLVSGSSDMSLRVWQSAVKDNPYAFTEFICVRVLIGHEHAVSGLVNILDTDFTISCSRDCSLRLWDRTTGYCRRTLPRAHQEWVRCLDANSRHLVSSGNDKKLLVFDLLVLLQMEGRTEIEQNPLLLSFEAHDNYVETVRLQKQETETNLAFSAGRDKTVRVWDYLKGVCLALLNGHDGWVKSLTLLEEEGLLLSAGEDRTLRIWDLHRKKMLWLEKAAHEHFVLAIDYRPRDRVLISGSMDRTVRVWQLVSANEGES